MSVTHRAPIQSTAGAIPIRNEKGDVTMEKVKVQRYVTGKRPDYAPEYSSDEEEQMEMGFTVKKTTVVAPAPTTDAEKGDRRLQRLQNRLAESDEEEDTERPRDRIARHRRLQEPEVLANSDEEDELEEGEARDEMEGEGDESSDEEELDEEEIERRRALLRQKMKQQKEEELLDKEEEKSEEGSDEESSEYEEYTDSEEEETGPRLKPVFVRKKDRITIIEREQEEQKEMEKEIEDKRMAEERRKQSLKMVEDEARRELEQARGEKDACDAVLTDDDNDEEEYEAWKVRELKRMKRDREEREAIEKEKQEIERLRNLTEEERKMEAKMNPKQITNKASKGKYKFLQKYYHRGAFFLDEEDGVYTRDFSQPTLDDHFDKTILPKVMQVKNFGRSGRTKYTHLVDQDTTQFDSPWTESTASMKFHNTKGGGMKQHFDRPSVKKKR